MTTVKDVRKKAYDNNKTGRSITTHSRISPRTPTTHYANPSVCARKISTRRPRGNGKLFTGVFDDD